MKLTDINAVDLLNRYSSIFVGHSANEWIAQAKARPTPKKLFGSLWHTGELSVLFADTGIGKTILAIQIADLISKGQSWLPFPNECDAKRVLYVDFELTDKQFQVRHTNPNTGMPFRFHDNFTRLQMESDSDLSDELIMNSIEQEIYHREAECLIIDNITYLKNETEKGRNALPLMRQLNHLKKKYDLSILVLAHTPKRDGAQPITLNDLYGSSMIANFIDGAFALGRSSNGPNFRYIKQLKCRSAEVEYHADNVAFIEAGCWENRLMFTFNDFNTEAQHLKIIAGNDKEAILQKVFELKDAGYSQREIADEIGMSLGYVCNALKKRTAA